MRTIGTDGIFSIEPVEGISGWYYGCDYANGDLFEAEELYRSGHKVTGNRLVLIRYPEGSVMSLPAGEHRYWGSPVGYDGCIYTLLVDFAEGKIEVSRFDCGRYGWDRLAEIALDSIEDCYNLMLKLSPPTLVRHSSDDVFETIWPERARFRVGGNEGLCARQGTRLYFSAWYEDPDYHEETLVRDLATGEVLERRPGAPWLMPDGQLWLLTNT